MKQYGDFLLENVEHQWLWALKRGITTGDTCGVVRPKQSNGAVPVEQ